LFDEDTRSQGALQAFHPAPRAGTVTLKLDQQDFQRVQ
jgi:hypothetical protein